MFKWHTNTFTEQNRNINRALTHNHVEHNTCVTETENHSIQIRFMISSRYMQVRVQCLLLLLWFLFNLSAPWSQINWTIVATIVLFSFGSLHPRTLCIYILLAFYFPKLYNLMNCRLCSPSCVHRNFWPFQFSTI